MEEAADIFLFEGADAVAELGGALELELLGGFAHALFQFRDRLAQLLLAGELLEFGLFQRHSGKVGLDDLRQCHVHRLDDALGRDAVLLVVAQLDGAAALGFVQRPAH